MAEFPCAMCAQNCDIDVIQCTNCKNWVHRLCVPMSASKFQSWSGDSLDFLCRNCCFLNGQFEREVQPELITIDDSDTSVYQNVTNMSDSTISDVHVNILNQNAKCVAFSTPVNFNIPEHHGLLTDLSDLDDSDDPVQFPPVTPVTTRIPRKASSHLLAQKSQEPQSECGY